eukprot:m.311978 g.311978  ORF g.311978 m.311978 type:complete len:87 (+) comp20233_c0_seq11:94-354(+)
MPEAISGVWVFSGVGIQIPRSWTACTSISRSQLSQSQHVYNLLRIPVFLTQGSSCVTTGEQHHPAESLEDTSNLANKDIHTSREVP